MSALLTDLITDQDYRTIVRDQLAAILLVECAEQKVLATKGVVSYTRAGASDYTARSTAVLPQIGAYTITAGTLVAGVGTWTAEAPDATTDTCTTVAATDSLVFSVLGLTLTVTDLYTPWTTGDVITVTRYDPTAWDFRVYTGRATPWQNWLESPDNDETNARPIVHITVDRQSFDKSRSNTFSRQQGPVRYFVDCYGYGKAEADGSGHTPGDTLAETQADWALTLVRKIIMSAVYHQLAMVGYVASRWPESVDPFQPQIAEGVFAQNIFAYRLTLEVDVNEFSPQVTGEPCEGIITTIRGDDGEILLTANESFT